MADAAALERTLGFVVERRRASRRQVLVIGAVLAGLAVWAGRGSEFNIPKLVEGLPKFWDLLGRMMPPDLGVLKSLMGPLLETLEMALLGTTIPIVFALPLAFLAAVNITPHPAVSAVARILIGSLRTVPELVWAMILVTAVGLGPFPGVIALTLHTVGGLGKFYYEAIESSSPGLIEAMQATGARRFKVIWFGVLPNVLPVMMSSTLFYWEYNNRASTVLGLVGAGGIGLALTHAMSDFRYREAVTCLILIVLILVVIDRFSAWLRSRII
jgi:phosphonate transport system permease protein